MRKIAAWRGVVQFALGLGVQLLHVNTQYMAKKAFVAPQLLQVVGAVLERAAAPAPGVACRFGMQPQCTHFAFGRLLGRMLGSQVKRSWPEGVRNGGRDFFERAKPSPLTPSG